MFEKLPIALRTDFLEPNVTQEMVEARLDHLRLVDGLLRTGKCRGAAFTGWLEPKEIVPPEELTKLKEVAKRLRRETDVLLVIGIGGSYLGARAVIEALADDPDRVVYAGTNISAHYMTRLRQKLAGKRVAINVISKSGTTTEPAIAFRLLKDLALDPKSDYIVATTDAQRGALRQLADREGYKTFVVPDNIGGRYSVLSSVGLLPIACAGIDIDQLRDGAADCAFLCNNTDLTANPACYYAVARHILYLQGFSIELLASFEPRLHYFAEWWKQLFGESEGKENITLFPASVDFTADLHSMGQYIQEGRRMLAETFLIIDGDEPELTIPREDDDSDGLNYLADKADAEERTLTHVNRIAYEATAQAHREGGVPSMTILLEQLDAHSLGALIYFFELACAIGGLMLGVNPFDQPGVEAYKKHMFEMLGKPGYEGPAGEPTQPDYVSF